MKEREVACIYYEYEGGPCGKRDIPAHFCKECQTCKKYQPLKGGKPRRTDTRRKKQEKINKRDMREY